MAVLSLFGTVSAHAAYAQLAAPAGWSQGAGGASMYQAANGEKWLQSTVRTNAALNVGGRAVQVGAAMRMAVNAPQFVAGRIASAAAFGPAGIVGGALTLGAMMAIPVVADWLLSGPSPLRWNKETGTFEIEKTEETGGWYWGGKGPAGSAKEALQLGLPQGTDMSTISCSGAPVAMCYKYAGSWNQEFIGSPQYDGTQFKKWDPVPADEVPAVLEQAGYNPLPASFPNAVPMPYPVQNPIVNPSPDAVPVPRPLTIPLGDPVPVPNSNPQQWSQPVARVTPSPTAQNPWRVDVREEEVVSNSPESLPDPEPTPDSPPAEEESASDTPLPVVPDFYEQKFPDGLGGVWDQRKAALQGTPVASLAGRLMPSGLGSGSCPQFSVNLDVGIFDGGFHDISIPCSVWDFGRLVIIITALLMSRRLIFGG